MAATSSGSGGEGPSGTVAARQRKLAFTAWVNSKLVARGLEVDDVASFTDSVVLINFLEALLVERVSGTTRQCRTNTQNIENMTKTFAFLEKRNLRPPQVSAEDVVEGRERAILSLLWTLYRNSIKGSILKWAQSVTEDYANVRIENFSSSFNDGLALLAILHKALPGVFDYNYCAYLGNAHDNLETAFSTASDVLNIPKVFDPEETLVEGLDAKAVEVYLTLLYEKINVRTQVRAVRTQIEDSLGALESELREVYASVNTLAASTEQARPASARASTQDHTATMAENDMLQAELQATREMLAEERERSAKLAWEMSSLAQRLETVCASFKTPMELAAAIYSDLSYVEMASRATRVGEGTKMGKKIKSWKDRLFVLRDGFLVYYESENDREPKGVIRLHNAQLSRGEDTARYGNILKIMAFPGGSGAPREYSISFASPGDLDEWIDMVEAAAASPL